MLMQIHCYCNFAFYRFSLVWGFLWGGRWENCYLSMPTSYGCPLQLAFSANIMRVNIDLRGGWNEIVSASGASNFSNALFDHVIQLVEVVLVFTRLMVAAKHINSFPPNRRMSHVFWAHPQWIDVVLWQYSGHIVDREILGRRPPQSNQIYCNNYILWVHQKKEKQNSRNLAAY